MDNKEFFDIVSGFYDKMIEPEKYLRNRITQLSGFINDKMASAADIGCGTGVDSIALSFLGFNVTGFDPSAKMIQEAKYKTAKLKEKIDFYEFSMKKIPISFKGKYDFITSLGNAVANIPEIDLLTSFKKVYAILSENGEFLLQILNFDKLIKENKRIVNITEDDENIFTRFYDFGKREILFNILTAKKNNLRDYSLVSTPLMNYSQEFLREHILEAGFKNIKYFGNLSKDRYLKYISNDLVILASK